MLFARLVGAALIGIGGVSFFSRNEGFEAYDALLTMKILWSMSAIAAVIISLLEGVSDFAWVILFIYVVFSGVWVYYKIKLN